MFRVSQKAIMKHRLEIITENKHFIYKHIVIRRGEMKSQSYRY
jgi:hypothetical protein